MSIVRQDAINPHLAQLDNDFLYHFGLDKNNSKLKETFGDTKYVCMGGSPVRAKYFAKEFAKQTGLADPKTLKPIGKTERYTVYKVGPIVFMSHGIGMPSMSIALEEITKLLHYSEAEGTKYIRVGTSGGLGVEPGTVVITSKGVNGKLKARYNVTELGKKKKMKTKPNEESKALAKAIFKSRSGIEAVIGKTMGTHEFYRGQGRLDGMLKPWYTEEQKMRFLNKASKKGVRNIEMESTLFMSYCREAGIPGAIVCTAILNRLEGDQVSASKADLRKYSANAEQVVINHIIKDLHLDKDA